MNHARNLVLGLGAALVVTTGCAIGLMENGETATATAAVAPSAYELDESGALIRPTDYRTWVYVGTPVTPNDMNNGAAAFPEHHNVYIDPASYAHYIETGVWREGTILVKELVSVGTKQAVSGAGYFQGEFIGLEACIKSAADFPNEPGNWAYFSFTNQEVLGGDLSPTATAFPASSCNACHAASARDDFVFTQHYPVLRAAKGARTTPENDSARPKTLGAMPAMGEPVEELTFDQGGREAIWQATASTPATVPNTEVPVAQEALFAYLQSKAYLNWETHESGRHPSRGPHTNYGKPVRVYMNDTMAASMSNFSGEHPVGASIVKEMYNDRNQLAGWAVEVKTHDTSDDGDGWFWYEVTSVTDGSQPFTIGNGVAGCVQCHDNSARDFVLSTWPLQ